MSEEELRERCRKRAEKNFNAGYTLNSIEEATETLFNYYSKHLDQVDELEGKINLMDNKIQEFKKLNDEINRLHSQLDKRTKKIFLDDGTSKFVSLAGDTKGKHTKMYNLILLWRLKNDINAQYGHKDNKGLPIKQIMTTIHCGKTSAERFNKILILLELIQERPIILQKIEKALKGAI